MAKLYYKYGAMNSGKTFEILRTAYNYEENGYNVLVVKPSVDKKGEQNIVSRIGMKRKVDFLITPDELISDIIKEHSVKVILADEAQFFTKEQIDDLWKIAKIKNIPVFCYGLKTDFQTKSFPGSLRLFELADKMEEITTLCNCGEKAMFNLRKDNEIPTFSGDQVSIDGFDNITYEPVCGSCYIKYMEEDKKLTRRQK